MAAAAFVQMDTAPMDTAASRTFALPELLEHILICLGQQERAAGEKDLRMDYLGCAGFYTSPRFKPPKTLFVLQCVNSTFRSAIARSKRIQSLMLLTHDSFVTAGARARIRPNFEPTWWLLSKFGHIPNPWKHEDAMVFQLSFCIGEIPSCDYWCDHIFRFARDENMAANTKPSWRNIKLAHSPNAQWPSVLELRIERAVGWQLVSVALDQDCTLGGLYDFFGRVTIYDEVDMLRLSHLHEYHGLAYAKVESLHTREPLAVDKDLLWYRELFEEEVKTHPGDWQAEKWEKFSRWDRYDDKELKVCLSCTLSTEYHEREVREEE